MRRRSMRRQRLGPSRQTRGDHPRAHGRGEDEPAASCSRTSCSLRRASEPRSEYPRHPSSRQARSLSDRHESHAPTLSGGLWGIECPDRLYSDDMRPSPHRAIREVPFLDLARAHAPLIEEIVGDVEALLESSAFVNGPAVVDFETAFARFCGASACVGTSSGLDALRIALLAGGLAAGDEVIVPAQTFVATLEAVTQAGGTPVVVDVSADDLCIDPAAVEAALTPRTRAVLPVHLYGQMADVRVAGRPRSAFGHRRRRGRVPGTRRHTGRGNCGDGRARGRVFLLPRQESRRDRRRGSPRHLGRWAGRDCTGAARAWTGPQVRARARGVHSAARHDPGPRAAPKAAVPRRLERRTPPGGRALSGRSRRSGRCRPATRADRERARVASVRACGRSAPTRLQSI